MNGLLDWLRDTREILIAVAILVAAFGLRALVVRQVRRSPLHAQQRLVISRLASGAILGVGVAAALSALGIQLGVLLGAAGVLTVAVGFAAQTSVSNLISGLFLMIEQPFVVGDVIEVDGVTGEVLSIDLISVRLRTMDNVLARIPNETMLKANVKNFTHFSIRRFDLMVGVAYKENLDAARAALFEVADRNAFALKDPAPQFMYRGFGESSIDIQFSVWARKEHFIDLKNSIHEEVKRAFDQRGIAIPYPHRTIYVGAETRALPVDVAPRG